MNDNVVKTCVSWKTEKHINKFYNKHAECPACNIKNVSKQYRKKKMRFYNKVEINMHISNT